MRPPPNSPAPSRYYHIEYVPVLHLLESWFTPFETPAIDGGDDISKASIAYRKSGVKGPFLLTGADSRGDKDLGEKVEMIERKLIRNRRKKYLITYA